MKHYGLTILLLTTVVAVQALAQTSTASHTQVVPPSKPAIRSTNAGPATPKAIQQTNAVPHAQLEVRLTGIDLYKALVDDVTREIDKVARKRSDQRWKTFGITGSILVALIGFLGIRSFTDLRSKVAADVAEGLRQHDTLKTLVEESVKAHVTSDIEARLRTVAKELSFYRLSNLATSIRAGAGFTNTERDAAVESLEQLQNEPEITGRKEFADALEKILDSFAAADLNYEIDIIDSSLQSVIMDTPGIVQTMLVHYGTRVLGDAEVAPRTVERFRKYTEACRRLRIYELALPYLMVYEHSEKRSGWQEKVASYIQDAVHLKHDEHQTVTKMIERYCDPGQVANSATGQVLRSCEKFKSFWEQFKDKIDVVPETGEDDDEPNKAIDGDEE